MTDLLRTHDAGALAGLVRARSISPVELVDAVLDAIEATEPHVNAFVTVCGDEARTAARAAEAAILRGAPIGPLHGVPVAVKDLVRTAGVRTTYGSRTHERHVPERDAVPVARLKRAGAIVVGKTTTPEFGHKTVTDAPLTGVTRNPWDTTRTCGGSSGGNAAAIAAGSVPIALGTDGGGSIRIPAACCGIVGLKPTLGRIAYPEADDAILNMSHYGPMTRSVADARLLLATLSGPDPGDAWSFRDAASVVAPQASPPERVDGLRVGWLPRVGAHPLDHEAESAARTLARALEDAGAVVEPVELDLVGEEDVFTTLLRSGLWARAHGLLDRRDLISDDFARSIELGSTIDARAVHAASQRRTSLFRRVQGLFGRVDVVVSPTLTAPAVAADQGHFDPVTIAGRSHPSLRTGWHPYAFVANLTGHPAVSVPCGRHSSGLPLGAQVIGRLDDEERLLSLAAWWERRQPWWDRWPTLSSA
jgi:aspartyl-tRNA(Asn)/glutamyl-tRNA(Gln) amidotransferase subunit A